MVSPLKEPKHVGQVAIFQLPGKSSLKRDVNVYAHEIVAVLLGIPLSPVATLLGITTKQLNYLHRFVGRMVL